MTPRKRRRTAPTIADVARRASVSLGTVSNVLNERGNVAPLREARVRDAIRTLGYVPNGVAQSLRRRRSHVVGLCAPLTSSAYFAALLDAFEDVAAAGGYEVMQVLSRHDPDLELRRVSALLSRQVDGLVIIPSARPQRTFDAIAASGIPAVVVDRISDDARFDYVTLDDGRAMREAARALLDLGHRRLMFVVRHPSLVTTRHRINAFRATLRAFPGATGEVCVREADDASFAARMDERLSRADRPTAIIASNSALLIPILRAIRHARLAVPRDVSVIAFDAPEWADVLEPPLALIRPPTADIARIAWARLLRRMDDPALPTERTQLSADLELAASVGVAR